MIEFLITIAIIAIIAALLLPALNAAREKAQKIFCCGNLKQIMQAHIIYTANNNDHLLPLAHMSASGKSAITYWPGILNEVVPISWKVFRCPVNTPPQNWSNPESPHGYWVKQQLKEKGYRDGISYGISQRHLYINGLSPVTKKISDLRRSLINFTDNTNAYPWAGVMYTGSASMDSVVPMGSGTQQLRVGDLPAHGRYINSAWTDGHVESKSMTSFRFRDFIGNW